MQRENVKGQKCLYHSKILHKISIKIEVNEEKKEENLRKHNKTNIKKKKKKKIFNHMFVLTW